MREKRIEWLDEIKSQIQRISIPPEYLFGTARRRYFWVHVERRPARPCCSIEYCQERNSSTESV